MFGPDGTAPESAAPLSPKERLVNAAGLWAVTATAWGEAIGVLGANRHLPKGGGYLDVVVGEPFEAYDIGSDGPYLATWQPRVQFAIRGDGLNEGQPSPVTVSWGSTAGYVSQKDPIVGKSPLGGRGAGSAISQVAERGLWGIFQDPAAAVESLERHTITGIIDAIAEQMAHELERQARLGFAVLRLFSLAIGTPGWNRDVANVAEPIAAIVGRWNSHFPAPTESDAAPAGDVALLIKHAQIFRVVRRPPAESPPSPWHRLRGLLSQVTHEIGKRLTEDGEPPRQPPNLWM